MTKHKKIVLFICLLALYLERELACRNLAYWINNTNNTLLENLWLFIEPYNLVILTSFLVIKKHKLSIIPIIIGMLGIIRISYRFISMEIWQFNHFEDYELFTPYDSLEIRTIFIISVHIIFFMTSLWAFLNNQKTNPI
jgi:hypothetical protein